MSHLHVSGFVCTHKHFVTVIIFKYCFTFTERQKEMITMKKRLTRQCQVNKFLAKIILIIRRQKKMLFLMNMIWTIMMKMEKVKGSPLNSPTHIN